MQPGETTGPNIDRSKLREKIPAELRPLLLGERQTSALTVGVLIGHGPDYVPHKGANAAESYKIALSHAKQAFCAEITKLLKRHRDCGARLLFLSEDGSNAIIHGTSAFILAVVALKSVECVTKPKFMGYPPATAD